MTQGLECSTCGSHLAASATEHDYTDWDRHEIAEVFAAVDAEARLIRQFQRDLREALAGILDDSIVIGHLVIKHTKRRRFAEPMSAVKHELLARITRYLIDPESGDRVAAISLDDARISLAPRNAPKTLHDGYGIDVELVDDIEVVSL